jgi:hypothetical protein
MDLNDAWKFLTDQEKTLPAVFSSLKTLEVVATPSLEPGSHLFCVYGDNWFSDLHYSIQAMDLDLGTARNIQTTEQALLRLKNDLDAFQSEYVQAKQAFDAATLKVQALELQTKELLENRKAAYEACLESSQLPYKLDAKSNTNRSPSYADATSTPAEPAPASSSKLHALWSRLTLDIPAISIKDNDESMVKRHVF